MNNVKLYTAAGGMEVCYLKDLPDKITVNKVFQDRIITTKLGDPNKYCNLGKMDPMWPEAAILREEHKLNQFYKMDNMELIHKNHLYYDEHPVFNAQKITIINEFKTMLAKKNPFAFIKDLNLQKIDELSTEYAMKFGDNYLIGVEARLSEFQKFFSIINIDDLKFYMAEFKDIASDSTIYKGKLVNVNPDNWICYRYENLVYLKELSQMEYRVGVYT